MNPLNKLIIRIITEQENIIGPLAVEQAEKVDGLKINWISKEITINGDEKKIIENLVSRYEKIFGRTSVEICREIVHTMSDSIPKEDIPSSLQ